MVMAWDVLRSLWRDDCPTRGKLDDERVAVLFSGARYTLGRRIQNTLRAKTTIIHARGGAMGVRVVA